MMRPPGKKTATNTCVFQLEKERSAGAGRGKCKPLSMRYDERVQKGDAMDLIG